MTNKQAKQVLARARELVSNGWARGEFSKRRGDKCSYCMVGAIDQACKELVLPATHYYYHGSTNQEPVFSLLGMSRIGAMSFNDTRKGSNYIAKREVIAKFDEALSK